MDTIRYFEIESSNLHKEIDFYKNIFDLKISSIRLYIWNTDFTDAHTDI